VLRALGRSVPALARRAGRLSPAERDSILRAQGADARTGSSSGGPTAGTGAGVSIGVGLPGGGPTRAQRQRDSALHADNVARLRRIQEQARRRADSAGASP
jgi:hypothetical protein